MEHKFLTYKGRPLVKSGNTVYYGSMCDPYVVLLNIRNTKTENNITLPNDVMVQLLRTDKNINPMEIVAKKSERKGIYNALEIADIWLTRALGENE